MTEAPPPAGARRRVLSGRDDAPPAVPVHRTKAEMAHFYLREQILNGTLRPGQRVTLAALAGELGISQMPVREALARLEREGLIVITRHTEARVARLEPRDASELFQIRAALESLAARAACVRDAAGCAVLLEACNRRFEAAMEGADFGAMADANWAFHRAVLDAADNLHLTRLIEDIWDRCFRFRMGYRLIPGRARATVAEHRSIIKAMRAGDAEGCAAAAGMHVARAQSDLLGILDAEGG